MSVSASDVLNLTIVQLKDLLKNKGLSLSGNKAELIDRVLTADPESTCLNEPGISNDGEGLASTTLPRDREIELYRWEKELAERELTVARRELELPRAAQIDSRNNVDRASLNEQRPVPAVSTTAKINITMLAELLSIFSGNAETYETWERQARFLKEAYRLDDATMKILIGTRLKGKAMEWFHSKPEYIALDPESLLSELKKMFHHRPNKIAMQRKFEERTWNKTETFHDYVHEKTILANHLNMDDDEVLGYIIDGIPDVQLRDVARLQGFNSMQSLLRAFEEISLRDRNCTTSLSAKQDDRATSGKRKSDKSTSGKSETDEKNSSDEKDASSEPKEQAVKKNCYNCGQHDHISTNCPTKNKGTKCFACGEYGHIAPKCEKKRKMQQEIVIL